MKKLLALVIAAGLCAGLCGCASTVSVSGAQIDADGHLIPSITDGSEPDAGLPGEKGENGEQGYDGGSGTRVTSAEDIKKAIEQTAEGGTAEISLANDLILSEPLKIMADTVIHGNGYKVKLDSDIKNSRIICSPRREKRIPETPQSRINTMFLRLCSFLWLRYKNLF